MQTTFRPNVRIRSACCRRLGFWLLAVLAASGCAKPKKIAPRVAEPPVLHVIHPQLRKIVCIVGQPSFVQSYERTSIYPKVTAFIEQWNVDIGDKVQKGDVLAKLFVPELRENWETKKATVKFDKKRVDLALKTVKVAEADVKAAVARLVEAQRILDSYKAEVDRWDSEVKRLKREVDKGVVSPQVLLESQNQLRSDTAKWEAAKATIATREADLLSKKAALEEDIVDVEVARTRVVVAESEAKLLEAWVGYLRLFAPYDGIIVARNANTWDFVSPNAGDPTADARAPHLSPTGRAAPIYVVDRTDIVRIFVDIPERDANYVNIGTEATVQIWAYRDQWLPAAVTRLSWALNTKSRTLRAEIDLPNPGGQILPGMYAYGKVIVERPNVRTLPQPALTHAGGKSFYWQYENGHAVRTEVETGISDGEWIEVTNRLMPSKYPGEEHWAPIGGSEQVLFGKLSTLTEGASVRLADSPAPIDREPSKSTSDATNAH